MLLNYVDGRAWNTIRHWERDGFDPRFFGIAIGQPRPNWVGSEPFPEDYIVRILGTVKEIHAQSGDEKVAQVAEFILWKYGKCGGQVFFDRGVCILDLREAIRGPGSEDIA